MVNDNTKNEHQIVKKDMNASQKCATNENPSKSQKRQGYISWEDFFMGAALLAAERSKDPSTQVGAVIVNKNKCIVSIGYNGMPIGCNDDLMPWGKDAEDKHENKYEYVCHANVNAILCAPSKSSIENAVVYTTLFPCTYCAKYMIQRNITEVVYLNDRPTDDIVASKKLFDRVGIKYRQFQVEDNNELKLILKEETDNHNLSMLESVSSKIGSLSFPSSTPNVPISQEIAITENLIKSQKRQGYLDWKEYHMFMALLASKRSKDPVTQVGAVIVNQDNIIVSTGYNGMPIGCDDDSMPWGKESKDFYNTKHPYVCHAEINAILNAENKSAYRGAIMYTTLFPCNDCAKYIIQSHIGEIVYLNEYSKMQISKKLFDDAKIKYRQFHAGSRNVVKLVFNELDDHKPMELKDDHKPMELKDFSVKSTISSTPTDGLKSEQQNTGA